MSEGHWRMRREAMVCAFLVALTVFCFWEVRHHEFLNFDDQLNVTDNSVVKAGLTAEGVRAAFTQVHTLRLWMPLTVLSHMLTVELFDLNAGAHHVANLALHVANTVLLFVVLRRMTGQVWPSAFVAALFAIHPLNVESVAWVTSRKDVLSTFFLMLTLLAYGWYVEKPGWRRYTVVGAFYALGLASKPTLVTLPFVLLLLDYWPLRRFGDPGSPLGDIRKRLWAMLREKLVLFGFALAASLVALLAEGHFGPEAPFTPYPLHVRLANASISYGAYIVKMVWPARLAPTYPYFREAISMWRAALAAVLLVCVSVLVVKLRGRCPYLPVGWFWYLGTLVPVIGIVQQGNHSMADRYTYMPLIGLFILLAWGIPALAGRGALSRTGLALSAGAALSGLMVVTLFQVLYWRDSETLFRHTLRVTTDNALAHNTLGHALLQKGEAKEAAEHFAAALRIRPNYVLAASRLGIAFFELGDYTAAAQAYSQVMAATPNDPSAHYNLGLALSRLGKHEEAASRFKEALRLDHNFEKARERLSELSREEDAL